MSSLFFVPSQYKLSHDERIYFWAPAYGGDVKIKSTLSSCNISVPPNSFVSNLASLDIISDVIPLEYAYLRDSIRFIFN